MSQAMSDSRPFDLVLFGATGFTGRLTAQYLAKTAGNLRWALAGRNRTKLEQVRTQLALAAGTTAPELLVTDVSDTAGVRALAERTRVVITTVGPYLLHGEPLVAACAAAGTDYADITGENTWVTRMAARYHAQALDRRAKIVHACGFDSIPHDLGTLFTVKRLHQQLSPTAATPITVEAFVMGSGGFSGGTWQSILALLSEPFGSPPSRTAAGRRVELVRPRIRYRRDLRLWAVPLPTIDPEIVLHSAQLLGAYGEDFRYGHYLGLKSLFQVIGFALGAGAVIALAQLKPTRNLLARLKQSGDGPSQAERDRGWFRVLFSASAGTARLRCQVRGGDPGYGETAKMLAETGLCLALDRERLPPHYGCVPSAAALGEVLIERLQRAGIVFEGLPDN
jgi:short subunit dehydrogenase-like uncharacterized protein